MKNVSYSLVESAPVQVKEAQVFPIHSTRHNLCPEASETLHNTFSRGVSDAEAIVLARPVKPANLWEIIARLRKEVNDIDEAVYHNNPLEAQRQIYDLFVKTGVAASFCSHIIQAA